MTKSIQLFTYLFFNFLFLTVQAQHNWPSMVVGDAGDQYKVLNHVQSLGKMNGTVMDSTNNQTELLVNRRVVDQVGDKRYTAFELVNVITEDMNYQENILGKNLLNVFGYFSTDEYGGNPVFSHFDSIDFFTLGNIYEQLLRRMEFMILELPNTPLNKELTWDMSRIDTVQSIDGSKEAFETKKTANVVGEIDTLGHSCFIVEYKVNTDETFNDPGIKAMAEMEGVEMTLAGGITGRAYLDKPSGKVIYIRMIDDMGVKIVRQGFEIFNQNNHLFTAVKTDAEVAGQRIDIQAQLAERHAIRQADKDYLEAAKDFELPSHEAYELVFPLSLERTGGGFSLANFKGGFASVKKDGRWGVIDSTGQMHIPFKLGENLSWKNGLFSFIGNRLKYGLMNREGEVIVRPRYDYINDFQEGLAAVDLEKSGFGGVGKSGYINLKGEEIIKPVYESASDFKNGLAVVGKGGKRGVINKKEIFIVEPKYQFVNLYPNFIAARLDFKNTQLLNNQGEAIFDFEYINVSVINDHLVAVEKSAGNFSLYQTNDFKLLEEGVESIGRIFGEYIVIKKAGKYGAINKVGEVQVPFEYDQLNFSLYAGTYTKGDVKGFINESDQFIDLPGYDHVETYGEKFIFASRDGQKYLMNHQGKEVYDLSKAESWYATTDPDYITINIDGKTGLLNYKGAIVIEPAYQSMAYKMHNGIIKFFQDEQYGFAKTDGTTHIPTQYIEVREDPFKDGYAITNKAGKWGMIDAGGQEILSFQYDEITPDQHGFIWVKKGDRIGLVRMK